MTVWNDAIRASYSRETDLPEQRALLGRIGRSSLIWHTEKYQMNILRPPTNIADKLLKHANNSAHSQNYHLNATDLTSFLRIKRRKF